MEIISYLLGKQSSGGGGGGTNIAHPSFVSFYMYPNEELDISWLRTDNITNMSYMFNSCSYLKSIDVSNFDTSNVTTFLGMFAASKYLTTLTGINSWDTSKVEAFNNCFTGLGSSASNTFSLDLTGWDFSSNRNCNSMFAFASKLNEIKLNSNNITNNFNAQGMFNGCTALVNLDLSNFDLKKLTDNQNMFGSCSNLSNDSLNSIMGALAKSTSLQQYKRTLQHTGFSSTQASTMTTLSNWATLEANGWTTGY